MADENDTDRPEDIGPVHDDGSPSPQAVGRDDPLLDFERMLAPPDAPPPALDPAPDFPAFEVEPFAAPMTLEPAPYGAEKSAEMEAPVLALTPTPAAAADVENEVFENEALENEAFENEALENEAFENEAFEDEVFEDEVSVEPAPADAAPAAPGTDLPPNFFRAAGDPEEPPPEPDTSLLGQARSWLATVWAALAPRLLALRTRSLSVAGALWRRMRRIRQPRSVREAAVWGGWVAVGGVAVVVGFFVFMTWGMPSADDVWRASGGPSITFVDRNGNVILREGAQNAPPVELETLPPYVAQSFIAIEDRRFYDHFGVDFSGMMRAGAENLRAGRVVQGGSTITQQLAKNIFLTNERSWRRKAQEVAMAVWLEQRFSKDQILALYLSRVYFGAGAYGIEAASERYFDRPARELTLLQSAMLAGLVKAPSRLNPARQDIAAARDRAEVVLNEMVTLGFISGAERDAALREELLISRRNPAGILGYYRDWIDPLLNEVIGTERDDFIIETTLDIAAQRAGADAVEAVLAAQGEERRVGQGALIALDAEGGVRAMVGGRDYDVSQFNRATQARRQPGSSFKYFIYLAAMENGLTPWSVRDDAPITISIPGQPDWSPGNYTNEYHGPTELSEAFAQSYNMVAIRVSAEVGGQNVIDVAQRLGVRSPLSNYHSLALGAQEITLLEMTQAYGAMAADGYNVEAHGVVRIRRANTDETMWSWRPQNRTRVIEERPMRYMNLMMRRVVEQGTGTRARIRGREIGGKTGTGNDYRDAWFVGFTPGLVAGVWVGNDNFTETARVTGGSLPAEIWARFMDVALRDVDERQLEMPGPDDYDVGLPNPQAPTVAAVGAPIGVALGAPQQAPQDDQDRSLDFGPEG